MSVTQSQPLAVIPKNANEEIRLCLTEYKSKARVDIRVWYIPSDGGDYLTGKQGVSIPAEHARYLSDVLAKAVP